jgi:surface antigen
MLAKERLGTTDDHGRLCTVLTGSCRPQPRHQGGPGISLDRRRVVLAVATACLVSLGSQRIAAQEDPDEEYIGPLINQALESERTGVEVPWTNPATGSSGTIVVERTFYRDPRTPCRDYRRTVERAGGAAVAVEGTGCRIGAGRWSLDEEAPEPTREALPPTGAREREAATPPGAEPESAAAVPEAEPEGMATPPGCPTPSAAPAACETPPKIVDYTMPTRTEL